jgi:hypothetical protein
MSFIISHQLPPKLLEDKVSGVTHYRESMHNTDGISGRKIIACNHSINIGRCKLAIPTNCRSIDGYSSFTGNVRERTAMKGEGHPQRLPTSISYRLIIFHQLANSLQTQQLTTAGIVKATLVRLAASTT